MNRLNLPQIPRFDSSTSSNGQRFEDVFRHLKVHGADLLVSQQFLQIVASQESFIMDRELQFGLNSEFI
jgi:hypothetical protein